MRGKVSKNWWNLTFLTLMHRLSFYVTPDLWSVMLETACVSSRLCLIILFKSFIFYSFFCLVDLLITEMYVYFLPWWCIYQFLFSSLSIFALYILRVCHLVKIRIMIPSRLTVFIDITQWFSFYQKFRFCHKGYFIQY